MTASRWFFALLLAFPLTIANPSPARSESYGEALARARELLETENDYAGALEAYREAERLTDQPSFDHWSGAAHAATALMDYGKAERFARQAASEAQGDEQQALGQTQMGVALLGNGQVSKRRRQAAIEALRTATRLQGSDAKLSRFLLARSLIKLGQDEEGSSLLRGLLEDWPDHPLAPSASSLLEDPRRARMRVVPDFEELTLAGETVTDQSLRGRVVLIDVWATWCAPCRDSVPHLKALHAKLADQPFTLLGVSVDGDEQKLRKYVKDSQMDWAQIWDADRELSSNRLRASAYPTYIVIDHEGVIRFTDQGWSEQLGNAIEREVRMALRRARKAAAKS